MKIRRLFSQICTTNALYVTRVVVDGEWLKAANLSLLTICKSEGVTRYLITLTTIVNPENI